jgi:hypothetical protein
MPAPLDEPLHKSTVNFFASDIAILEAHYGRGWGDIVRRLVREHVRALRPRTIEDLMRQSDGQ